MTVCVDQSLSERECATVVAALRYWQREGWRSDGVEHEIANLGGLIEPLNFDEINALVGRLNGEEDTLAEQRSGQ